LGNFDHDHLVAGQVCVSSISGTFNPLGRYLITETERRERTVILTPRVVKISHAEEE